VALEEFLAGPLRDYQEHRDRPDYAGTSRLSPHLHFGEVSVGQVRHALGACRQRAAVVPHADAFERQLGWREFAAHLLFHFPHSASQDLDARFDRFGWAAPEPAVLDAWHHGRTGIPLVDAGMRQLWQEGWMHNRVRMVVASFLTKNLRLHWLHGARWFHGTLVDADLANNTMGWQWVAGTGADAAPYFRVFNPVAQSRRFDPDGRYIRRWLPELGGLAAGAVHAPWTDASAAASLGGRYPATPIVDLAGSRERAIAAYRASRNPRAR
jgi:deoxyribodipyrimidine photo-lyase